jgi:hypothetical protein
VVRFKEATMVVLIALLWACEPSPLPAEQALTPQAEVVPRVGLRRLSIDELDNTLRDLVLDTTRPSATFLPADVIDPFDNNTAHQVPSDVSVQGFEALANDVASRLVADPERRESVVGCTPTGPADRACLESFVADFAYLALRRPVSDEEVARYVDAAAPFAQDSNDFWASVDVVLRAVLQHPEFLYRVERGEPTDEADLVRLDNHEVATRLSYLLWGTTPDAWLLDRARRGALHTPEDVVAAATEMLTDPRALDRLDRFHAMWLGYWMLPHEAWLNEAMRQETRLAIQEVVFTAQDPWVGLFTLEGSFLDDALAAHYGLPEPGSDTPQWVRYDDSGRLGLLSQGSFLSVAARFGDTSPTQRGKLIRERLLCQVIPPPPPDVDVDSQPGESASDCKWDAYAAHRESGACRSCHEQMDPVGFGLENYDQTGRHRTHDIGRPDCPIDGTGDLDGATFTGPAGLAETLVASPLLPSCMVTQLHRFAVGREVDEEDAPMLQTLTEQLAADGRLDTVLLGLVGEPGFGYRRPEVWP